MNRSWSWGHVMKKSARATRMLMKPKNSGARAIFMKKKCSIFTTAPQPWKKVVVHFVGTVFESQSKLLGCICCSE